MKLISLVSALLLVLCGCSAQPEPVTVPSTIATEPVPEPTGIYDEASEIEMKTDGAIKAYPLGLTDAAGFSFMGSDILLFSGKDTTTLIRYTGSDLRISAAAVLDCKVSPVDAAVQANPEGITYYDPSQKELVFLNAQLEETGRTPLPETIFGTPALSADRQMLYYSTTHALRCIDLVTGLDRLLAQVYTAVLSPVGLHCGGTVLACHSVDEDGTSGQLYVSTKTGAFLYETSDDIILDTHRDSYFVRHKDGIYTELLIGSSEHGPTLLTPHTYGATAFPLMEKSGAVLVTEDSGSIQLDYYDLHSGKRTGHIALNGSEMPHGFQCSTQSQEVWFLRYDPRYQCDTLFCWDPVKSKIADGRSCLSARYSADHPDLSGLAACRETAERLSYQYGVQILLWTDATSFQPWDYILIPEYQVPVIREKLKELEQFLSLYPAAFLQKAAELTSSGHIQICLVRSILGKKDAGGAIQEAAGLQYWDHNRNTYLCLSTQQEKLAQHACHEMSHIIDSRVLTVCRAYDDWSKLNPSGFRYTQGDVSVLSQNTSQWLEDSGRAFIDSYSMSYPKEDRARIMEYAMADGNAHLFESETMQKKLRQLCIGIREAFELKGSSEIFTWEQYLKSPLNQK